MSREEEETSYLNESHIDLLSKSEEECSMVAQDSPSSEDLDDFIVTFGQENSEKEHFEKYIMNISLNKKAVQKKKCPTSIQEELQMKPHILQNTLEKKLFAENRACVMKKKKKKTAFGGEPNEKYEDQILMKKESATAMILVIRTSVFRNEKTPTQRTMLAEHFVSWPALWS